MGSTMRTGLKSDENVQNLANLRIGMTEEDVLTVMGRPYKSESYVIDQKNYDIWFYITEPTILGQSKPSQQNFTPVIFKDNILVGWGNNYYNYLMDIDNSREKYREAERQKYTNDRDEWPRNEHVIIPPPSAKKTEDNLQEELEETEPAKPVKQEKTEEPKPEGEGPCKNRSDTDENYNVWE